MGWLIFINTYIYEVHINSIVNHLKMAERNLEKQNTKQSVEKRTTKVSWKTTMHLAAIVTSMLLTSVMAFAVGIILCVERLPNQSEEWTLFDALHYTNRQFLSILMFVIAASFSQLYGVAFYQ